MPEGADHGAIGVLGAERRGAVTVAPVASRATCHGDTAALHERCLTHALIRRLLLESYPCYTRVMKRAEHKERITVTVDPELVAAANEAVRAGRADSLSGWVNLALVERAAKERRLRALSDAVAAYEAEFGAITPAEMAAQRRADERAATVVRGVRRVGARRASGRSGRRGAA